MRTNLSMVGSVIVALAAGPALADDAGGDPMEDNEPFDEDPFDEDRFDEDRPVEESRKPLPPPPRPVYEEPAGDSVGAMEPIAPLVAAPEKESNYFTPHGLAMIAGGGVMDYFDEDARDVTGLAGTWEVRLVYGTRSRVGVEAAYIGSVQSIDALGLDSNAVLVGNRLEGAMRVNAPSISIATPYAFGGIGITRFDVANTNTNNSSVEADDTAWQIPVGLGLGLGFGNLLVDIRGTVRSMFNDDITSPDTDIEGVEANDPNNPDLHSWEVGAKVGLMF